MEARGARWIRRGAGWGLGLWLAACGHAGPSKPPSKPPPAGALSDLPPLPPGYEPAPPAAEPAIEAEPAPIEAVARAGVGQVALWREGEQVTLLERRQAKAHALLLLDVGRSWVPAMFRSTPELPHNYEARFVELQNGIFPDTPEGRRAQQDRYLELYGIPPSPALLAQRFTQLLGYRCAREPAPDALLAFEGARWDEDGDAPDEPVDDAVIAALQKRLLCGGYLRAEPSGELDLRTRRAIEEFERRHRIYARGDLAGDTLHALKQTPAELEREALLRVLTERLLLELGVIEDGSAIGVRPEGVNAGSPVEQAPDLVSQLRSHVESALGLETVEGVAAFYLRLGDALDQPHYTLAFDAFPLPAYHWPEMDLFVEIDRGDVYYDFPYDESGVPRPQPVERRPTLTLFARHAGKVIPLARYGTTIGGWRVVRNGDRNVFMYKESPVGQRLWAQVVSAPVWLPPPRTPPSALLLQTRQGTSGELIHEINDNLVGPGYASAYGLVAAYHRRIARNADGEVLVGRDEAIRTHGSSDYTSIWRRASLGCHRLHNHLAVRLFSFVLAHRKHRRTGHGTVRFRMPVRLDDFSTVIEVHQSGYAFELARPLPVEVLRGRVLGDRKRAPAGSVPVDRANGGSGPS